MIGMLKGRIELRQDPYIILDVNGVGYKVLVSQNVLANLPEKEKELKLYIYTHVREDLLELYGFTDYLDLKLFEQLIGVSGIGCKSAIGVFSVGSRLEIIQAVLQANVAFFTSVSRLGKKNAQKIIIELKSKLGDTTEVDLSDNTDETEAVAALRSFGFTTKEAAGALRAVHADNQTTAEKVRLALKYLGK